MSVPAIIMMLVGLGVTWGGAAYCIRLAIRRNRQ
ncbi:hypothetical protein DND132_1618 [Pseudodesulfovibrio mercurii]|uniref:MetS family NSS transporter small subunit n=1 Tax=Pseudodesulfovibrio mercurii TaxID=641491 RepID=F0JF24_9BACT|nr:MetS family NSS transporter small subunit [Pseudodesulfovibrio mercurii]EGB14825.1 hypothetical protein DND132_1618 [Pseudodesulfovibrio mercurii]